MKFDDQKFTRLDGKLHIFRRQNSSFWWCGFHHHGKYLRTSTKETIKREAISFAEDWFHLKKVEIKSGKLVIKKEKKFKTVAKDAIKSYRNAVKRGERSQSYFEGIERLLTNRILPFFGEMYISDIDNVQWRKFKKHFREHHNPNLSRTAFHQLKNAVRIVLNEAFNSVSRQLLCPV